MSTPGYGGVSGEHAEGQYSGTAVPGLDPTMVPGNYSDSIFGVRLPQGTGAPGSAGAQPGAPGTDPTNQPGQTSEKLSGLGPDVIADTGAPGSSGAQDHPGGGDTVKFTRPGSYLSGTYEQDTVSDDIAGTGDWTGANDQGYGTGGPQLPGIKGNEPTSTGAGGGRVLRGGRYNG